LPHAPSFFIEDVDTDDEEKAGMLSSIALSVIAKIMYVARVARPGLLRTATGLSSAVTRWKPHHDRCLRRLVAYAKTTKYVVSTATIGDDNRHVVFQTFVNSEHAGDQSALKSTTGAWLELSGPNIRFAIDFASKRQAVRGQQVFHRGRSCGGQYGHPSQRASFGNALGNTPMRATSVVRAVSPGK